MTGVTLYNPRRYRYLYEYLPGGITHLVDSMMEFDHPTHRHVHHEWQVLAVLYGKAQLETEAWTVRLRPGTVCVVPPGCEHRLQPEPETVGMRFIDLRYHAARDDGVCRFLRSLGEPPTWQSDEATLAGLSLRLQHAISARSAAEALPGVMSAIWQLLTPPPSASERADTSRPAVDHDTDPRVASAINFMRERYYHNFSASELAASIDISPSQLRRLFERHLKMTPAQYQAGLRISQAKSMLHITNRPVGEIARRVGFDSLSHFCRVFRAREGVTPREYRRRLLGQDA
jgi:AraC-like DNA-binding protein/mannose-6-phosphate isomerase-like protein (cupin superfamily)